MILTKTSLEIHDRHLIGMVLNRLFDKGIFIHDSNYSLDMTQEAFYKFISEMIEDIKK